MTEMGEKFFSWQNMLGIFDLSSAYNIVGGRVVVTTEFCLDTRCLIPHFAPSSARSSVVTRAVFWQKNEKIAAFFSNKMKDDPLPQPFSVVVSTARDTGRRLLRENM